MKNFSLVFVGILIGAWLPVRIVQAQSVTDVANRSATALEHISQTLDRIENKLK